MYFETRLAFTTAKIKLIFEELLDQEICGNAEIAVSNGLIHQW